MQTTVSVLEVDHLTDLTDFTESELEHSLDNSNNISSSNNNNNNNMRLPTHRTNDEDRPFLGHDSNHIKSVRLALDNLSEANNNRYYNNSNNSNFNKLKILFMSKPYLKWLLLSVVLIFGFLWYNGVFSNNTNIYSVNEIPKLDFTLTNIISASIGLSQMAGQAIIEIKEQHKENIEIKGQTHEHVDEPVTLADKKSNSIFLNGFRTLFDNDDTKIKIISEEDNPKYETIVPSLEFVEGIKNGDEVLDKTRTMLIIDPLDATKEFTEETDTDGTDMLPYVTTLVCVVYDNKPIAGIINRPFVEDELVMWGVNTEGNNNNIHGVKIPDENMRNKDTITFSRSHTGMAKEVIEDKLHKKGRPAGGAGFKTYLVLSGQAHAYVHVTAIKTWDLCAGHALLKTVGGDITDKAGKELIYKEDEPKFKNGLIAAMTMNDINEIAEVIKDIQLDTGR